MLIVVDVVHASLRPHDARHLVQKDVVVSLHDSSPLLLHLELLQVQVEVHVRLRRLVVYHRAGIAYLTNGESYIIVNASSTI